MIRSTRQALIALCILSQSTGPMVQCLICRAAWHYPAYHVVAPQVMGPEFMRADQLHAKSWGRPGHVKLESDADKKGSSQAQKVCCWRRLACAF